MDPRELGISVVRAWKRYWFRSASLTDLALFRAGIVGSQLLFFYPRLEPQLSLLGQPGILYNPLPMLQLMLAPFGPLGMRPSTTLITIAWWIGIIAGVLTLAGVFARVSLIAFAWANTTLVAHLYSYGEVHHNEAIIILSLGVLVLAPAGGFISVRAVWRRISAARSRGSSPAAVPIWNQGHDLSEYALWPLRVIQWLLCLAYLSAALHKIKFGGLGWFEASTLRYYLIEDATNGQVMLGLVAASYPWLLPAMAVFTVAFELTFILVMFVPVLVWVYIPLGIILHTGVLALQGITFFEYFFAYVAFIDTMRRTWPVMREKLRVLRLLVPNLDTSATTPRA